MGKCIVCGAHLSGTGIMTLHNMPASAQNIPDKEEVVQDAGISLSLFQCQNCGLVQFDCEPVAYYKDVIRAGGFTSTMRNLRREQYAHLIETYHLQNKKIIEVGCGQGEFLQVLKEFPVEAYGIENKQDLVEMAREKGLDVWKGFAEKSYDKWENGPFDAFLSFNFLEHQPNPNEMLQVIYDNLCDGGIGLITVPSFEYILENDGYYELIRDHIAYYTFDSLRYLLVKNHFEVLEQQMINRDTLSVIVRKKPSGRFDSLLNSYEVFHKEIDDFITDLQGRNKTLAIWGASHQGFTIAATTNLQGYASYIVDSAPFKQGKYAPASHLPIVPPKYLEENPVDSILIVAPGYTEEIKNIILNKMGLCVEVYALRSNHMERL